MSAKNVRINLRYDAADLERLVRFARVRDVELGGRYDIRILPCLNIWTHSWANPGCKAESALMFSLEFDLKTRSLMSVTLQSDYDWGVFLDELARLERMALGDVVYGKRRAEPIA